MGCCLCHHDDYEKYEPLIVESKTDKITMDDFVSLKVVGRGSFGKVLMVRKKGSDCIYAMKVLKKKDIELKKQRKHTRTERDILASIKHPFIVELYYAFQSSDRLCFVMEFLKGGELFFHLRRERVFNEYRTIFYASEILLALECLHKHGVIYRDLKPENVMLDDEGHIKLTDFGLAKKEEISNGSSGKKTYTFCGTPEYLAPEIITGAGHNKSVDWWSLGAIIYEMLSGNPPFREINRKQVLKTIIEKDIQFDEFFSPTAIHLLKGLMCRDPRLRLGASDKDADEIKAHPFFAEVNWKEVEEKKVQPPFRPHISSETDYQNFDRQFVTEEVEDSVRESMPWKNEIIYPGFTYENQDLAEQLKKSELIN